MPKPPEVPEVKAGETELQTYRAQLAVLNDTLSLKRVRAGGAGARHRRVSSDPCCRRLI